MKTKHPPLTRASVQQLFGQIPEANRLSEPVRMHAAVMDLLSDAGFAPFKHALHALFPHSDVPSARKKLTTQVVNRPPKDANGEPVFRLKHSRIAGKTPAEVEAALANAQIWFESARPPAAPADDTRLDKPMPADTRDRIEATEARLGDGSTAPSAPPAAPPDGARLTDAKHQSNQGRRFPYQGLSLDAPEVAGLRSEQHSPIEQTHASASSGLKTSDGRSNQKHTPGEDDQEGESSPEAHNPIALNAMLDWAANANLNTPRLLALLGEYGSGKTTHAQYFSRVLSGLAQHPHWQPKAATQPLPTARYIDLAELALAENLGGMALEELLLHVLKKRDAVRFQTVVDVAPLIEASRSGQLLFVFDGLDELLKSDPQVLQQVFNQLLRAIEQFAGRAAPARMPRMVVSCRTHYFRSIEDQHGFFTARKAASARSKDYLCLELLPWDGPLVESYLNNRLSKEKAQSILQTIERTYNLGELASRPVLLAMIGEHLESLNRLRERGQDITAASLYSLTVASWLARDGDKHRIRATHKPLLMGALAHAMWVAEQEAWEADQLDAWLARTVHLLYPNQYSAQDMQVLQNDLRTATFVVRPDARRFAFAHKSFGEYFLARFWLDALDHVAGTSFSAQEQAQNLALVRSLLSARWLNQEAQAFLQELHQADALQQDAKKLESRKALLVQLLGHDESLQTPAPALHGALWRVLCLLGLPASLAGGQQQTVNLRGLDLRERLYEGQDFTALPPLDLRGTRLADSHFRRCTMGPVLTDSQTVFDSCVLRACTLRGFAWGPSQRSGLVVRPAGVPRFEQLRSKPMPPGHWSQPRPFSAYTALAYLPASSDGAERVVSGGDDGTARVWDARTGQELAVFKGHSGAVMACAVLPASGDGAERVVSAGLDGAAVWCSAAEPSGAEVIAHNRFVPHPAGLFEPSWAEFGAEGQLLNCNEAAAEHWLRWVDETGHAALVDAVV